MKRLDFNLGAVYAKLLHHRAAGMRGQKCFPAGNATKFTSNVQSAWNNKNDKNTQNCSL